MRELSQRRPLVQRLHTVYYDTPRPRSRARAARAPRAPQRAQPRAGAEGRGLGDRRPLRARRVGGAPPGPEPDLERIPSFAARALALRAIAGQPLEPVFETDFKRTRHRLLRGDTELWLDFDEGEIRARGAQPADPRDRARAGARRPGRALRHRPRAPRDAARCGPSIASKAQRGYALATGTRPAPQRAPRIELARRREPRGGAARRCSGRVSARCSRTRSPRARAADPEGVHQLRVGLRRARAALALFRDAASEASRPAPFKSELRWLAGRARPGSRSRRVPRRDPRAPGRALPGRPEPEAPARRRARAPRRRLRAGARRHRLAPRARRSILALGGWLVARGWRAGADAEALRRPRDAPAAERGAALLERRLKKARRLGRGLARRTPEERHRLRIELKKLRYAGEFLGSPLPGGAAAERMLRAALGAPGHPRRPERRRDGGAPGCMRDRRPARARVERRSTSARRASSPAGPPTRRSGASPASPSSGRASADPALLAGLTALPDPSRKFTNPRGRPM